MFIVVIMSIVSFLLLGAWSIMQHAGRMQQAIHYEYKGLQRSELVSGAALYALEFFKAHVRTRLSDYTEQNKQGAYQFTYVFTEVTNTGALVRIVIHENGRNSTHEYRISEIDGVLRCIPRVR